MMKEFLKDPRWWTVAVSACVAAWLVVPRLLPAPPPAVSPEEIADIRYVCRETGEVFTRPATAAVLPHPVTGEPTLVPAVYDARKKRWRPGPPPDVMHRQGLLRPAS
jgi:hypothetical protein